MLDGDAHTLVGMCVEVVLSIRPLTFGSRRNVVVSKEKAFILSIDSCMFGQTLAHHEEAINIGWGK
jgi:hypothetical protein